MVVGKGWVTQARTFIVLPLHRALIDENTGHVNIIVCEQHYKALKRGIDYLPPPVQ